MEVIRCHQKYFSLQPKASGTCRKSSPYKRSHPAPAEKLLLTAEGIQRRQKHFSSQPKASGAARKLLLTTEGIGRRQKNFSSQPKASGAGRKLLLSAEGIRHRQKNFSSQRKASGTGRKTSPLNGRHPAPSDLLSAGGIFRSSGLERISRFAERKGPSST